MMIVFPIIAALVSTLFSFLLFRQFKKRHRLPQFAWGIALAMYAVASFAVAAGIGTGWDPTLYRAFWLFGALLNVPWLAVGSVALLGRRGLSLFALVLVALGSVFAIVMVAKANINQEALKTKEIPIGKNAFCTHYAEYELGAPTKVKCDAARGLAQPYSIPPFLIVVGIAILSGRRRKDGYKPPPDRVRGNWIIAIGVTINAIGGFAFIGRGHGGPFSIILAISVTTMFAGFVMASKHPRVPYVLGPETQ